MANDPTKVITGRCRTSFPNLFAPRAAQEGQTPKYGIMLLIPKTDKATMKALRAAQLAALENGKSKFPGGKVPKVWKDTIHDGDEADLDQYPEREGHWCLSVSAVRKPGVIDRQKEIITDPSEVYSGCYVRAALGAFAYNTNGNRGVSFGLNHVQKIAEGDALDGSTKATDVFDELDDEDDDDDPAGVL